MLGPNLAVLRAYSFVCAQWLLLADLRALYVVLGIEPGKRLELPLQLLSVFLFPFLFLFFPAF